MSVLTPSTTNSTPSTSSLDYRIDVHLATEIGQHLVSKMRCMQTTIQQQQESLNELSEQLNARQKVEERLNDEIWHLELAKQEYIEKLEELNRALARSHLDQARMMRQSHLVTQELELLKDAAHQHAEEKTMTGAVIPPSPSSSGMGMDEEDDDDDGDDDDHHHASSSSSSSRPQSWSCARLEPVFSVPSSAFATEQQSRPFSLPPPRQLNDAVDQQQDVYARLVTGDWMWKYTRTKTRHARFVWIEPDTKVIYWKHASQRKSAIMESFMVEVPPMGSSFDRVPNLIIKTRERQVKLQCMTMEAHRRWVKGLNSLLKPGIIVAGAQEGKLSRLYLSAGHSIRNLRSFYRKDISVGNQTTSSCSDEQSSVKVIFSKPSSPYDSKVEC